LAWGVEPAPAPSAPPRKPAPVQADRPPEADPYAGWFALDDDLPRYVLGGRLLREHPVHPRAAAVRDALAKLRRRPQPLALLEQDPETGYSTWVALRGGSLVGVDVRGVVAVWDLESGRETSRTPVGGGIDGAVVLGPDALLLSVQGPRAGLYAWSRGRELQSLIGRKVNDTSLVADATHFAAGTFDGKLHVFDRATHARVLRLEGLRYASEALALSPDGRALAAGAHSPGSRSKTELTEAELGVWDLAARSQTARVRIATQPRELRYSADSGALYVGSTLGTLECRDARTLALRFEFVVESADEFLRPRAHVGSMRGLEVLPDGRLLSLSRAPGKDIEPEVHQLHVWDPRDGRFLGAVAGLVHPPVSLAVDPERELIAVGTSTGHVVLLPLPRAE
ncbi:MAG: hypothetical protein KDD82_01775, partial [Planctomycetes bacterium]|nr:hypothetical protein [Planctomycetota bacterium]